MAAAADDTILDDALGDELMGVPVADAGDGGSDAEEDGAIRKRKVAVLVGYCGTGYYGMQLQLRKDITTIEGDLLRALHTAGMISDANMDDVHKISWMRCARTDKGVHAAANVVSAKLLLADGCEDAAVGAVNAALPPAIRVLAMSRVTKGFHSKNACNGRQYEYVLPSAVLAPRSMVFHVARTPRTGDEPREAPAAAPGPPGAADADVVMAVAPAAHHGVPPVFDLSAAREAWDAATRAGWQERACRRGASVFAVAVAAAGDGSAAEGAAAAAAPFVGRDGGLTARREAWAAAASARAAAAAPFRMTPAHRTMLAAAMAAYKGSHAFHNFTPKLTAFDASIQRYIVDCAVSDPYVVQGAEFVNITIRGQSFLLNMIRHMIGLVVDVVAGAAPPDVFSRVFDRRVAMRVPLAPAAGLYLHKCFFEMYNQRFHDRALPFNEGAAAVAVEAFRTSTIVPHVVDTIIRERVAEEWLRDLMMNGCSYRSFAPSKRRAREASATGGGDDDDDGGGEAGGGGGGGGGGGNGGDEEGDDGDAGGGDGGAEEGTGDRGARGGGRGTWRTQGGWPRKRGRGGWRGRGGSGDRGGRGRGGGRGGGRGRGSWRGRGAS